MDVLVLIDKLDDLVHNAKAVPLTDQVRIDREEIYDILDQMRATIPEEIKQARWIVKERQEMLAEAKRECDRLIGEAREQAMREASQTEIVKLAERQSQDIVEEARRDARETRVVTGYGSTYTSSFGARIEERYDGEVGVSTEDPGAAWVHATSRYRIAWPEGVVATEARLDVRSDATTYHVIVDVVAEEEGVEGIGRIERRFDRVIPRRLQ